MGTDASRLSTLRGQSVLDAAQVTEVLAVVADPDASLPVRQQALDLLEVMVEDLELAPRLLDLKLDAAMQPAVEAALATIGQHLEAAGAPVPTAPPDHEASEGTRILWRLAHRP